MCEARAESTETAQRWSLGYGGAEGRCLSGDGLGKGVGDRRARRVRARNTWEAGKIMRLRVVHRSAGDKDQRQSGGDMHMWTNGGDMGARSVGNVRDEAGTEDWRTIGWRADRRGSAANRDGHPQRIAAIRVRMCGWMRGGAVTTRRRQSDRSMWAPRFELGMERQRHHTLTTAISFWDLGPDTPRLCIRLGSICKMHTGYSRMARP
ncbi:hypothetical protein C8R44DRAFT_732026 [Mycena epipterygia]|nr:hypothetical protein C8R44DRAFT_732026 [Mycena epipterygia]